MSERLYDATVREVARFVGYGGREYIIINQSYWYPADVYTEETAKIEYMAGRVSYK
jgi:hypothetical protein